MISGDGGNVYFVSFLSPCIYCVDFLGGSVVKDPSDNAGDAGLSPG